MTGHRKRAACRTEKATGKAMEEKGSQPSRKRRAPLTGSTLTSGGRLSTTTNEHSSPNLNVNPNPTLSTTLLPFLQKMQASETSKRG
jgi:hypothetical protein